MTAITLIRSDCMSVQTGLVLNLQQNKSMVTNDRIWVKFIMLTIYHKIPTFNDVEKRSLLKTL